MVGSKKLMSLIWVWSDGFINRKFVDTEQKINREGLFEVDM